MYTHYCFKEDVNTGREMVKYMRTQINYDGSYSQQFWADI